jgi:hypothetical protein
MYNSSIHKKIQLLGYVMDDIAEVREMLSNCSDPSLILEYEEELESLIEELNEVAERCIYIIGVYVEACKENNEPVYLDYYRVYKELKKAQESI